MVPIRTASFAELVEGADYAVSATVTRVENAAEATGETAGAEPGAPSLPRQAISLDTVERYYGDPGADFKLTHVLLPGGIETDESPAWRVGQTYVLFLRKPVTSGSTTTFAGTLQIVSNDGRLLVDKEKKLKAILPGGPAFVVEEKIAKDTLAADIRESKRKGPK